MQIRAALWCLDTGALLRSLSDRHVGHKPTQIQQAGYFIMVFFVSLSLHVLAGIKIKPTELQRAYEERAILCREAKQINAITPWIRESESFGLEVGFFLVKSFKIFF